MRWTAKSRNIPSTLTPIKLSNEILQLAGAVSIICGFIVMNFLLALYISVKKLGGNLEKRHIYVIGTVALLFAVGGAIVAYVGSITA